MYVTDLVLKNNFVLNWNEKILTFFSRSMYCFRAQRLLFFFFSG